MYFNHAAKAILFLTFILMITACGNSAGSNNTTNTTNATTTSTASPSPKASESSEVEALTKKVQSTQGEVDIPIHPKRIVTEGYLPELLLLGLDAVGAPQWEMENKVLEGMVDGVESTGEGTPEAILALDPDLIITWAKEPHIIEMYEGIAPTLVIPANKFEGIHEKLHYLGDILGKESVAEQWLADFDQTIETSRSELAKLIKPTDTFSLMGVFVVNNGFYIYGDGEYRGGEAIYKHLQLTPPEKQLKEMFGKETYRKISYEVISDYAGDYIFLDQGELISEVWGENDGIWKSLDAVKNDRVLNIDPELFWGNDAISLKLQIQEIVKMIAEKNK